MDPSAALSQDLQTILTIIKWVVGIITPIVTALSYACYKLWQRNNEMADKHGEELKELWKTTLDAFVEQGKVVERLSAKVGGGGRADDPTP